MLQELSEIMRQEKVQTPMVLSSFTLQIKLDQQILSFKDVFLISPFLSITGLAN